MANSADMRRYSLAHVLGAVLVAAVVAGVFGYNFVRDRTANVATAQAWDIKGADCPSLGPADWTAKRYVAQDHFDYDGLDIGRHAGHASCSDVKTHGGAGFGTIRVCQFTSPAALSVKTPKGTFYFVPGPGQPASLIIEGDVPRCVMASKFTLNSP